MYPITLHADTNDELDHYVNRLRKEDAPDVPFSFGHQVTEDQAEDYDRHRFVTLDEDGGVVGIGELVSPSYWREQKRHNYAHTSGGRQYVIRNRNGGTVLLPVVVGEKSDDLDAHPLLDTTPMV